MGRGLHRCNQDGSHSCRNGKRKLGADAGGCIHAARQKGTGHTKDFNVSFLLFPRINRKPFTCYKQGGQKTEFQKDHSGESEEKPLETRHKCATHFLTQSR